MDFDEKLETKKVFTDKKDLTLSTLREMYDEGDIDTNPIYQRDFLEDWKKASKLIESLILEIPIPTVYLCQEIDNTFSVIDGQQRLTSFIKFLKNEFELRGLQELPELNGKKFCELDKTLQKKIKSSTVHAIYLLKESQELKYEIFARLNLGSEKLEAQELRNCIYRGPFNDMLEEIAAKNNLIKTLFIQENSRKIYQEYILRFFALKDYNSYKSSLAKTMNAYMQAHQNDDAKDIEEAKKLFTGTLDIIKQVLGDSAFKTYSYEKKIYLEKFSKTAYDSIMIAFSCFPKNSIMRHSDEIRGKIKTIRETDEEYAKYIEKSTNSKASVVGRILKIYSAINSCMSDNDFDIKRAFSSDIRKQLYHENYICSYCGNIILSIDDAEIDHTIPFSLGGETDISNAQLLHRHCNREKSNNVDMDWDVENDGK